MLRSRSLDLSFIRRGRKRSAIRTVSQAFFRSTCIMAAVSVSTGDSAAPSKRSRGLADIDPKFVSNSGLSGLSELGTPRGGSVRIQHRPPRHPSGISITGAASGPAGVSTVETSRFPKLDECAHFHYDVVDLGPLTIQVHEETGKVVSSSSESEVALLALQITSYGKSWVVRRSYEHFRLLDEQLHRCIYDRKFSQLPLLPENVKQPSEVALRPLLSSYVNRLSAIAGNLINCAPVLNWLEVDNRGRRLYPPPPSDDADAEINTPAVAAAYAVRRYAAIASDEISFEVGDMISVIDMPPPEESMWWRGKRGFDVGFFPSECVRIIGDKVPAHLSLPSTSPSNAATASKRTDHHHLLNQSGCSGGSGSSSSGGGSTDHLPTKPVLRKHGKLISFFRSFILSRPSRRKLKQSGILKERVFGCDLGEHLLNSGREIPMVLKCCAEFIEEYGVVDGIYRLSGITSNIQKLRNAFDEDRVPALVEDEAIRQDMHAVSSLLKMYFRELPNPLCTYQLYDQFVNAVQGPDNLRVVRMREVVQQLPPPHFRTLEYLTRHLSRVAEHNASTGMTAKNVAIVWAPNLLRCKELEFGGVAALQGVGVQAVVTECLVRYVDLIFSDKVPTIVQLSDVEVPSSSSGGGALKRTRPKSLAISTPTKLLSLEEARNRALQLATCQNDTQYIEVGGGPASLPPKYHTVIELPNGDARSKRGNSLKHKKSPLGWKSLFAKPSSSSKARSPGNNKAQRKNSSASTSSTISMPIPISAPQRAVTYVRPRLRPVKSAESLVASNRNSSAADSNLTSPVDVSQSGGALSRPDNTVSSVREVEEAAEHRLADDDADEDGSLHDGSLSRCHNRSVSHDSYFRLLMTSRTGLQSDPLDEEADSPGANTASGYGHGADAIYAEISKPGTKNSKEEARRATSDSSGQEFGKDMNLTAVEDPHSGSSKLSLNDLSHLDDSELNIMNSREMLAVSKKTSNCSSQQLSSSSDSSGCGVVGRARPASVDDSVIDDSARGLPMNAEQIDEKGNWAASNPAYELFCIQAEIHHHQRQRAETGRSPSPDNTEAQMPDMPSEMAMDGDSDSLVNVITEDYSSTEVPGGSDRESFTLHGPNDVYENVNVTDHRVDVESQRQRTSSSPVPAGTYENFADNHTYAMVRVASSHEDVTYENVIDSTILDEEYEPIETPNPPNATSTPAELSYENVQHQQPSYENIDHTEPAPLNYENLIEQQQPNYENVDDAGRPDSNHPIDETGETYENVVMIRPEPAKNKPLEIVNVYEDVVPPPPRLDETEEIVYHQVKVLRQSIQEVNELLRQDPTVLQIAIADLGEYPVTNSPSPVKVRSSPLREKPPVPMALHERLPDNNKEPQQDGGSSPVKKSSVIAKESPSVKETTKLGFVIKDIQLDEKPIQPGVNPAQLNKGGVRLSLSPKRTAVVDGSVKAEETSESGRQRNGKDQHIPLSVSLPSLLQSNQKVQQKTATSSTSATSSPVKNSSLPPTPLYDLRPESESVSSKRRFESEIGRDLLHERRIRNEVEHSRRSESNLLAETSPLRRQSTSESSGLVKVATKPALPIKMNARKSSTESSRTVSVAQRPEILCRPTTLETSFDYEPSALPLERTASSPPSSSGGSSQPLSPVSPGSTDGLNTPIGGCARKTSVKELLNKFQTGNSGDGGGGSDRSSRVTTPTSPVKPALPASSSPSKQQQPLALLVMDESKNKMGKENIQVHLTPAVKCGGHSETSENVLLPVESNDPCKSVDMDHDGKEQLRQKSLNVGIDMSDPRTRLRIERYKEERRSFLREKYKSESFRSDTKEDAIIVRLKQKAGSPTQQHEGSDGGHYEQQESQQLASPPPPPCLQTPHPGLIDEDVNVKERAAQWAQAIPSLVTSPVKTASPTAATSPVATATHRSCSEAVNIAPQHKRIRDMAALFEKETP